MIKAKFLNRTMPKVVRVLAENPTSVLSYSNITRTILAPRY